jgi:[ribosomal protein S5]-alanine N-acetyltransferase
MSAITSLPALLTPHLLLREIAQGDAHDLASFMTQPRYQRYIAHRMKDESEIASFVRRNLVAQSDPRRRIYHLAVEEQMTGEVVGDGFIISHHDGSHELGWGLHPALWRMGFGTEIGGALLGLGFETLKAKTMWCKVMVANTASARLAKKIGLAAWQQGKDHPIGPGHSEVIDLYRITAESYFDLPY